MKTVATVESLTGGLLSSKITSIPGSSKFYKGSLITYSNEVKEIFRINTSKGVVNAETALEMAKAGKKLLKVDICISLTGNAGPDVLDNKKVGLVYVALNDKVYELNLKGSRNTIRKKAAKFAFNLLKKEISI